MSIGRFTQTDPLLGNRPFKHYSYGSNNPVSRVDPMGLQDFASKAQEEAFWNSVGGAEGGMAVPDHVMKSWTGYQQNAWAFVKDKQWHWKYGMGGGAGRMKDRWYAYAENDLDDQAYVAAIESLNTQERKAYMARLLREAQGNKNIYLHDIMAEFVPGAGIEHFFSGRDFSGNPVSQSEAFAGLLMELPWAKAGKAFTALRGAGRAAKAAGAVGKSGGKPIRIALGLAQHPGHTSPGVLGRFGRHVDALTWDQWHSAGLVDRYNKSLQDLLTEGMRKTDQIHFNLDGIDPKQFRAWAKNPVFDDGVTNWELHQVLSDPALRAKATFYQSGGKVVEAPMDWLK